MHHWLDRRIPGVGRFGRRTLILVHGGLVWILYGWTVFHMSQRRFTGPPIEGPLLHVLDSPYMGFLWLIGGSLALINAPLRRRWHGRDVLGFIGLLTPPMAWLCAYTWSALNFVFPGGVSGSERAFSGMLLWYLVSIFVLIVAGWPDPDDPAITVPLPHDNGGLGE